MRGLVRHWRSMTGHVMVNPFRVFAGPALAVEMWWACSWCRQVYATLGHRAVHGRYLGYRLNRQGVQSIAYMLCQYMCELVLYLQNGPVR